MKRPIWQRVFFGEVLWKDKTTTAKALDVAGYIFALMMLMKLGLLFVVAAGALFTFRYRKLLKAEQ